MSSINNKNDDDIQSISSYEDQDDEKDLNVDNYTLDELIEILKLTFPISIMQIKTKVSGYVDDILNQDGIGQNMVSSREKNEYIRFFKNVENRLLDNFDKIKVLTQGNLSFKEQSDNVKNTNYKQLGTALDANHNNDNPTAIGNEKIDNITLQNSYQKRIEKELGIRDNAIVNVRIDQQRANNLHNPDIVNVNSDFVIERRQVPEQDTFNKLYPKGVINPVRKHTIKQVLSVDSVFKEQGQNTNDFIFKLNNPIKNIVSMKLVACELPNSWYSFSAVNKSNIFYIDMFNLNDGTGTFYNDTYTIEIPPGNYTPLEFVNSINNIFYNTAGPNVGPDFLAVRIDKYTGKVIIRANNLNDTDLGTSPVPFNPTSSYYSPNFAFNLRFQLDGESNRSLQQNAGWMLGFRKEEYYVDASNSYVDILNTSPGITYQAIQFSDGYYGSGINTYVFLEIDDFNKNTKSTVISGNDKFFIGDNIIARISLKSGSNTLNIDTAQDNIFKEREYFGPITLEKLRVRLIDKFNQPVEINNTNYSLSLELTQIYS